MIKLLEALQGYWGIPSVHRRFKRASLACPDLNDGCQLVSPHSLPRWSRTTGFLQGYRHDSSEKTPMITRLFNFCLYHVFWCPVGQSNDTYQRPESCEWNLHKCLDTESHDSFGTIIRMIYHSVLHGPRYDNNEFRGSKTHVTIFLSDDFSIFETNFIASY